MRRTHGHAGMSLVESTAILAVLSLVTSVLAPQILSSVNDAKATKVKEDVEAIGVSVWRALNDLGLPCLVMSNPAGGCTVATRADLLVSDGSSPAVTVADYVAENSGAMTTSPVNWAGSLHPPGANTGTLYQQLVANAPLYSRPADFSEAGGPHPTVAGWRGAYVPPPVGPDPWGRLYQVNTMFLGPASDATGTNANGEGVDGWNHDVIVVSAGPNQRIETRWAVGGSTPMFGTLRGGDDVIYVVSGSTR